LSLFSQITRVNSIYALWCVYDTFWYLSATPELLTVSCSKYEEQFGGDDDEI